MIGITSVRKWMLLVVVSMLAITVCTQVVTAETDPNTYVIDNLKPGIDVKEETPDKEQNQPAVEPSKESTAGSSSFGDYIRMILAFLFVIGLLLALLKFLNRRNRMFDQHRLMKNIGGLSLGQQKSIQLVHIGNSYYLVGVGNEVQLLKEITDANEIAKLEDYIREGDIQPPAGLVAKVVSKYVNPNRSLEKTEEQVEFGHLFKDKINELKEERKKHLRRLEEKERRQDE